MMCGGSGREVCFLIPTINEEGILNFLEEQKTAVINGAAGTGKTLVAIEKAKRHACKGEKVLFLRYNNLLKTHLAEHYP